MPTPIEARRLSGVDIGKTVQGQDVHGTNFDMSIRIIEHGRGSVQLWGPIDSDGPRPRHTLRRRTIITITGKPSPITGPDCQANKHQACDGRALDEATDEITRCQCTCHP